MTPLKILNNSAYMTKSAKVRLLAGIGLSLALLTILVHLGRLELTVQNSPNLHTHQDINPWIQEVSPSLLGKQLSSILSSDWKTSPGGFNIQSPIFPTYTSSSRLRHQLEQQFPYDPLKPMPKHIWQTYKHGLESPEFPKHERKRVDSWVKNNPEYKHSLLSDEEMHRFVETEFATIPLVVEAFKVLPKPVLQADFFRYLVVFARGGIYTDVDTVNLKPIGTWISSQPLVYGENNNPGLVVGVESSIEKRTWRKNFTRLLQLAQWTLQGKPGHPALLDLISHITEHTIMRYRNNELHRIFGRTATEDVMNWTGPGAWTDSVLKYLDELFQNDQYIANRSWEEFTPYFNQRSLDKFSNAVVVHDVVILPLTSFCPENNGGGSTKDPMAYVEHCYDGSWKNGKLFG